MDRLQKKQLLTMTGLGASAFFSLLDGMWKILNQKLTFSVTKIADVSNIYI